MDLSKIASAAPAVLLEGARLTRKLAQDNIDLQERNDALERELTIHKLAMRMQERDLESELSIEEKVAKLREVDSTKLASIEAAVEMSHGGFKLGSLKIEEELISQPANQNKSSGELGSSARYERLDDFVRSL